jgi:hypothetical protein
MGWLDFISGDASNTSSMGDAQFEAQALKGGLQSMGYTPSGNGAWNGGFGNFLFGSEKDGVKTGGAAIPMLQAAGDLFGAWNGMKQLKLGKKQLGESQRQFDLNFGAQKNMVNNQIYDRQVARIAASPQMGYMSPDEAMAKWGVK